MALNKKNDFDPAEELGAGTENRQKPKKKKSRSARFKYGWMSTALIAGVLVLAVLINVGATALVERFPSLRIDMTADRRHSMTEDFTELVDTIGEKTQIIFCGEKDNFENTLNMTMAQYAGGDASNEGTRILELSARAAERNSNITVRFVDLETDPGFASNYSEELGVGSIIIQSDRRHRVLDLNDLYQTSTNNNTGESTYLSNVEYAIGNAMLAVNVEKLPVVGIVTGNSETEPADMIQMLTENNFDTVTIDLTKTAEIDSSVDVLMIQTPLLDFSKEQIAVLDDFLNNGGNYGKNVVFALTPGAPAMPNLNDFLADWGMEIIEPGSVVLESNSDNHFIGGPTWPLLEVGEETIFSEEFADDILLGYMIAPVRVLWDSKSSIATEVLIKTSDTAYRVPAGEGADYEPAEDELQSYPVLVQGAKGKSGSTIVYSRVSVITSSELFNQIVPLYGVSANGDAAVSYFRYLTGTTGDEDRVYIAPKDIEGADLTITKAQADTIGMVIFMVTIPLALLIAGLVVWLRRRHL